MWPGVFGVADARVMILGLYPPGAYQDLGDLGSGAGFRRWVFSVAHHPCAELGNLLGVAIPRLVGVPVLLGLHGEAQEVFPLASTCGMSHEYGSSLIVVQDVA